MIDESEGAGLTSPSEDRGDLEQVAHRPVSFDTFFGQHDVVSNLKLMLEAAKQRGEPVEHMLFSGPPGLGKTSLAHVVAAEMETQLVASAGPLLERPGDLVAILSNLSDGQVLFVDEIHRLPRGVEEVLYSAMEDFRVDIIVGTGPGARTITMPLRRFTLVGATTRTGLLTAPLRDRFGVIFQMQFYTAEELAQIIANSAGREGIQIDEEARLHLAAHSRGTPRVALRLLRRVRDFAQVKEHGAITLEVCQASLEHLGIGELGLNRMDREMLEAIITRFGGGPVGLDTIAAVFHEEPDVIAQVHEPYLLKLGLLMKTPRGRVATSRTYEYLGLPTPEDKQDQGLFDE